MRKSKDKNREGKRPRNSTALIKAIRRQVKQGRRVFLLPPGSKIPVAKSHGFKDATEDVAALIEAAREQPDANLAVRTGAASGIVVLDFDRHVDDDGVKHDGFTTKETLERELGPLPKTFVIATPTNGEHHYFACDAPLKSWSEAMGPGFDVRGESGYVVVPPSRFKGKRYCVGNDRDIVPLPKAWTEALTAASSKNVVTGNYRSLDRADPSPVPAPKSLAEIMRLEIPPIRWGLRKLIPEGVTLLAGAPKMGKTFLMFQGGLAKARGEAFFDDEPERRGVVLYISYEDQDRRIQKRMKQLVPDGNFPKNFYMEYDWPRMDAGGIEAFEKWMEDHPNTRMIVIDTLVHFRTENATASSIYSYDYKVGRALSPLAKKHRVAFVLVHHTGKGRRADILESVSATNGLAGAVDTVLILARERGCRDGALFVTGKDIVDEGYRELRRLPSGGWSFGDQIRGPQVSSERTEIIDALKQNGAMTPHNLAEVISKSPEAVRQLLMKMIAAGEVTKKGKLYQA